VSSLQKLRRLHLEELSVERLRRAASRRADGVLQAAKWLLDPGLRDNRSRLAAYQDRHRGERCVIVGNGPSLNRTDLSLLRGVPSFGLNRIYLMFDRSDFRPTYLCCFNTTVLEQFSHDLLQVPCTRFVNLRGAEHLPPSEDTIPILERFSPRFRGSPSQGLWAGATVTFAALQLAYFMGFSRVVLVGVDHHFSSQGEPGKLVRSTGDDMNHFDPRYFSSGVLWDLPDLETSEWSYSMARQHFEGAGRSVVDATVEGRLEVFPKVDLADEMARPWPG
jgi:hypothetical protein